ncbi:MAG: hypothetical protein K0S48_3151, partial [Ramlibacter sp.]|nr:hypothetical protein [Ramlibacter sp.]
MPDVTEPLSWRRIDPYYLWSVVSGFGVDSGPAEGWLPLLVEAGEPAAAAELRQVVQAKFGQSVACPPADDEACGFILYVAFADATPLLTFLSGADARWEMSLPLLQRAPAQGADAAPRPVANGQVIGFIDYGCAFAHRKLRVWENGKRIQRSRVLALWDQAGTVANLADAADDGVEPPAWQPPEDFGYGMEWHRTSPQGRGIDRYMEQFLLGDAIDEEGCYRSSGYAGIRAGDPHGTYVMDLAVGHPSPLPGPAPKEPPKHDIVFVELPRLRVHGYSATWLLRAQVLAAVKYIFSCAKPEQPVAINLSYGGYAGSHDGGSILERALDEVVKQRIDTGGPTELVIAAGNAGTSRTHAEDLLPAGGAPVSFRVSIPPHVPTDQFVEIWFDEEAADCELRAAMPGQDIGNLAWNKPGSSQAFEQGGVQVGMLAVPKSVGQSWTRRMALLAIGPTVSATGESVAPSGVWTFEARNPGPQDRSDRVTPYDTLNSLAHGKRGRVVGGYVGGSNRVPDECSRGTRNEQDGQERPPLNGRDADGKPRFGPEWLALSDESEALPGLAGAARLGNEQVRRTGTSVACAVATRHVVRRQAQGQSTAPPPH